MACGRRSGLSGLFTLISALFCVILAELSGAVPFFLLLSLLFFLFFVFTH